MMDNIKVLLLIGALIVTLIYGIHTTVVAYDECKSGGTVVRGVYKMECVK